MQTGRQVRILVLRGGALGDFILTLPALAALRARWPGAWIELVGYPRVAELARLGGLVDRVTSLDRAEIARLFSMRPELSAEQVAHLRSFDLVLSYLYDPFGTVGENLAAAGVRDYLYGSPRVEGVHAADFLMRPLERLAIFAAGECAPRLTLGPDAVGAGRARLRAYGERVLVVHPGSGSPRKNWPLERFVELSRAVRDTAGLAPVFTVGEADAAIDARLGASQAADLGFPVLRELGVGDLAGCLAAAAAYAGNDSGVSHLAAAVGTPSVVVFGPTDPAVWAPRGPNARLLAAAPRGGGDTATIPTAAVLDALRAVLSPHPPP